ncbi:MAG: hypothetical protein QF921_11110 [Pseudomonadales bacterium]|jgi:hypothetical protein|nr:hypothetical protein [Pseudomonadales bacterium]MDP6470592.1 hypothetical protein [Pseudomonadales bacterium]MDP6828553.1 hypothetical protein [Pseudomonadales bacterium]MDP6972039.1 hypothetical protein [Pseudomonadales bacterium]|tara:strand:- start:714 stop:1784 length:1071 start_codon:yes stop_codon:yes gene_type:complete
MFSMYLVRLICLTFVILVPGLVLSDSAQGSPSAPARPDLSGTYDAATLTPLVRPKQFGNKLYLTREEAEEIATTEKALIGKSLQASAPDREAPPQGGDGSPGAAGNVGGYNSFWIDRGTNAMTVDGKFRTSIIVDPEDGQFPPMTPEAKKKQAQRFASSRHANDGTAWWLDRDSPGPYDNMEQRSTAERCLLGFSGATPSIPSLYNNYKRIVQTNEYVMILIEMVHDARIVRMNAEHVPADVNKWLGDSIGWWEDDTLVVDTTNFHPQASRRGSSENTHVVERFTRLEDGNLLYRFTVENGDVWTAPWTGEYIWRASDEKVYEYACHEGNYALGNIMRGARILEKDAMQARGGTGD